MACCLASNSLNAQSEQAFSSHTIDLGCVVSDVDKAVAFYTQAIGFKQVSGFSVPGDYASKVGLTDVNSPFAMEQIKFNTALPLLA